MTSRHTVAFALLLVACSGETEVPTGGGTTSPPVPSSVAPSSSQPLQVPPNRPPAQGPAPARCQRNALPPNPGSDVVLDDPARLVDTKGPEPMGPAADVGIADMDGDGRLDVVISRGVPHEMGNIEVLYARSRGWSRWVSSSEPMSYGDLEIADLNRDGCLDLVVAVAGRRDAACHGGVLVVQATGSPGHCELPSSLPEVIDEPDYQVVGIGLGDIDGNGWADIAATRTKPDENCTADGKFALPVAQVIHFNDGKRFTKKLTTGKIAAAFTADVVDADGDGDLDALFGGTGAELAPQIARRDAFALLSRWSNASTRDVMLRIDCGTHCDPAEIPNLMDLEVMPKRDKGARVGTAHTSHHCDDNTCRKRSAARVFDLPSSIPEGTTELALVPFWTSEGDGADGCTGPLETIESAALRPASDYPDLIFGVPVGGKTTSDGDLVVVPGNEGGFEPLARREHYMLNQYDAYAMAVADLDGSSTQHPAPLEVAVHGGVAVSLPEQLHTLPSVKCDGRPVAFNYTIEATSLSLVAPCAGKLTIDRAVERSADVVYVPRPPAARVHAFTPGSP